MFGWLVIAHGLSHAVLAMEAGVTATLRVDAIAVSLYAIGMIGFVSAGLGLLGLQPFVSALGPLLVLASGLSLVAIVQFADAAFWFGGVCDAALFLMGVWRGYIGWPAHGGQSA